MNNNRHNELSALKTQQLNDCVTVIQNNQSKLIDAGQNACRMGEQLDKSIALKNYQLNDYVPFYLQISMNNNRHNEVSTFKTQQLNDNLMIFT